ncbi:MAG: hypothetical protein Q8L46_00710 [candidate division WWE3 bacterium]|nr:hypothetical protein [candidate division WWE3 bacterium]
MSKICVDLERGKANALWVATKCLRQLFGEVGGGIPRVSLIRPLSSDREYTQVEFALEFGDSDYILAVRVNAGDLCPKQGTAYLTRVDNGAGVLQYRFVLEGKPDYPVLKFIRLGGGGSA